MRITFDTNCLDRVCRPARFPNDPAAQSCQYIHAALASGEIEGLFPITMLTIEGIARADRGAVYASTRIDATSEELSDAQDSDDPGTISVRLSLQVSQPERKPLHPEVVRRVRAARALGFKALRPLPRLGAFHIDDTDGTLYAPVADLDAWLSAVFAAGETIAHRGVGAMQARQLGERLAQKTGSKHWYEAMNCSSDIHEERAVQRAFAEWADGDAVASHIAHSVDIFCSDDAGNSNALPSILDTENRTWLTAEHGVQFATIESLATMLRSRSA